MRLKDGVKLHDLKPPMVVALIVVRDVCAEFDVECVVTSANDSKHGDGSLHYYGRALDFRTKYPALDGREQEFRDEVKARLGNEFDVVMEAVGTENEHLHVEHDPK